MKKLLFILVTVLVSCMSGAQNTQVTLSSGVAEGSVSNGIYVYKGIPYAKAERFMPPPTADVNLSLTPFASASSMSSL